MRRSPRSWPLLLALAAPALAAPAVTTDDLQKAVDANDWPTVLRITSRLLPLTGPAAADVDRVDLWNKKAEAQLHSSQFLPASKSFASAAAEKKASPEQVDLATAMAELSKKSDARGYKTPARQGPIQSFDIVDPAKQPDALAALFKADAADLTQRVDAAKAVTEAKPLAELMKAVGDLRPLDRVANKSTDQSDGIEVKIADHFVAGVKIWTDTTDKRLAEMKADADTQVEVRLVDRGGRTTIRQQRKGVSPSELSELRTLMQQAEKLANTYTPLEKVMGPKGKDAIKPAQASIQATYDQTKTLQTDALRPHAAESMQPGG